MELAHQKVLKLVKQQKVLVRCGIMESAAVKLELIIVVRPVVEMPVLVHMYVKLETFVKVEMFVKVVM